ncbi:MAG: hypothetical protein GXO09_03400 [Crenarchaeota archaeon]|nr:hypothetical protein [Thermoproteota archaeon]
MLRRRSKTLRLNKVRVFLETPLFLLYALAYHSGRLSIVDAFLGLVEDRSLCKMLKSYCRLGDELKDLVRRNIDPGTALLSIAKRVDEPVSSLLASYAQVLRISGDMIDFLETWSQTFLHRVDRFIEDRGELVNTLLEVVVLSSTMLMLSILFLNLNSIATIATMTLAMGGLMLAAGFYLQTPSLNIYLGLPDKTMTLLSSVSWALSLAGYAVYLYMGLTPALALLIPGLVIAVYIMYKIRMELRVLDDITSFLEVIADEVRTGVRLDTQVVLERLRANPRLLALSYVLRTGLEPSYAVREDPLTGIVKKFLAVLVRSGAEASRAITTASSLLSRMRTFITGLNNRGLFYEVILALAVIVMIASIKTYCSYMTKPLLPGAASEVGTQYGFMPGLEQIISVPSEPLLKITFMSIIIVLDAAAAAIAAVTRSSPLLALSPPLISLAGIAATMVTLA